MLKRYGLAALCLALCLAIGACSPVGTGGKESALTGHLDPKKPVTVTLWHYYVGENQRALEAAVTAFNQQVGMDQGVIVEAVAVGSIAELEESVTASAMGVINSQPMPQAFSSYPDKALEIGALDMVTDLSGYLTEEERGQYVADFLADGVIGGKLLLLPIVKSTELMYLNETDWRAFAADTGATTDALAKWETLYDTARDYYQWTAQQGGGQWDGRALMGFDSVANYVIIGCRQLGLDVIDASAGENGEAVLDKAVLRRVFDGYFKGMSLGYYGAVGRFRSDDIKSGDLIAYVGSSSSAAYFPTWVERGNAEVPIDFMPLQYPVFEGGEDYAIQQGAGVCVSKSTPAQQEGAVLFLKWFAGEEENIRFAMTTGYLPVSTAAYGSEAFESALANLRAGEVNQQNVAGVYEIALQQITELNTYAATPFAGSYDVRTVLQATLIAAAEAGMADAQPMKDAGQTEAEILQALDVEARFEGWLDAVTAQLDGLAIAYTVQ